MCSSHVVKCTLAWAWVDYRMLCRLMSPGHPAKLPVAYTCSEDRLLSFLKLNNLLSMSHINDAYIFLKELCFEWASHRVLSCFRKRFLCRCRYSYLVWSIVWHRSEIQKQARLIFCFASKNSSSNLKCERNWFDCVLPPHVYIDRSICEAYGRQKLLFVRFEVITSYNWFVVVIKYNRRLFIAKIGDH
jgi:hypothetical protein